MSWWHWSISGIYHLLLTQFWPNFKGRFLGPSLKDANHHGHICPGKIYPGDICSYQQHLSSHWLDFDETLKLGSWENIFNLNLLYQIFLDKKFFDPKLLCAQCHFGLNFFSAMIFFHLDKKILNLKFLSPKFFWIQILLLKFCGSKICLDWFFFIFNFFGPKIILNKIFLGPIISIIRGAVKKNKQYI